MVRCWLYVIGCVLAVGATGCAARVASVQSAHQSLLKGQLDVACNTACKILDQTADESIRLDALRVWVECMSKRGLLDKASGSVEQLTRTISERYYARALITVARSPAKLNDAVALLKKAQQSDPAQAEFYYRAGVLWLADGRPERAEPLLRRSFTIEGRARYRVALAFALFDLGRRTEALNTVKAIVDAHPSAESLKRARGLMARAVRHCDLSVPREAEEAFVKAVRTRQHPDLHIAQLERLVRDYPEFAKARTLLGLAYLKGERTAEALVALRRAAEQCPADARNHYLRAMIFRTRGNSARTIALLRRAVSVDPFFSQAWVEIGKSFEEQGAAMDAARAYADLVKIDNSGQSLRLAGRAFFMAKRWQKAVTYYGSLAKHFPNDFEANLRLATALLRMVEQQTDHKGENGTDLLVRARLYAKTAKRAQPESDEVDELLLRLGH